jgi:hypothetical protein
LPRFLRAGAAAADGPIIDRFTFVETMPDDFILDICGIDTMTTITGSITVKEFPDGSVQEHVNITLVSDDPRLPIEKQAATRGSADAVGVLHCAARARVMVRIALSTA